MKISELKAVGKEVEKMWRINALHRYGVRPSGSRSPYTCSEIMLDVDKEFGTDTKSLWVRSSICCPRMRFSKPTGKAATGIPKLKTPTAGRKDAQAALQDKITALENEIQDSVRMSHRERWINYVKWPRTRQ